jgi:hypothetical protein
MNFPKHAINDVRTEEASPIPTPDPTRTRSYEIHRERNFTTHTTTSTTGLLICHVSLSPGTHRSV